MSPKTTTEPELGGQNSPHDLFLRSMVSNCPEFAAEIAKLKFSRQLQSELDMENVEVRIQTFVSRRKRERRPDWVLIVSISEGGESDPPVIAIGEHKSYRDDLVMSKLGEYMNEGSILYEGSVVVAIIIYHGEEEWDFDTTYPKSLNLFSEELRQYDLQSLHMRVYFLNLNDEKVMEAALNLQFAPVFYILPNIWKISEKVVVRVLELLWEKFPENWKLRDTVAERIFDYIMRVHPDIDKPQLIDIEARNFDEGKRIMPQILTLEEDYIERGRQEGRQENQQEVAENMIRGGLDDSSVVKFSGLSSDDVSEVRRKLNGAGS